jgi:Plavaka transposase
MDPSTAALIIKQSNVQSYNDTARLNATGTFPVMTVNDDNQDNTSAGNFPVADLEDDMDDYEGLGFVHHDGDQLDLPGYQTTYTTRREVEIRLLKLCTELEAPLYAFEEIMKWARHAFDAGYDFLPKQSTYRDQVKKIEIWMGLENHRPKEIPVELPCDKRGNDTVDVTVFDFKTQLQSLLDDPVLNRDENLVVNGADPFTRYVSPNDRLGECLSGSWYNHAWNEMEKDGLCNFMIPIIFYIDKTQVSTSGKLSIHPVQMSLGIFTEKVSTECSCDLHMGGIWSLVANR